MELTHSNLTRQEAWPDLLVDQLNVFYASTKGGKSTAAQLVESLLVGLRPELAAHLWRVNFSELLQVDELLSEGFLRRLLNRQKSSSIESDSSEIDRRRIEELIHQRDAIADRLEKQLSVRRRESDLLLSELRDLEATLARKCDQIKQMQSTLDAIQVPWAQRKSPPRCVSYDLVSPSIDSRRLEEWDAETRQLIHLQTQLRERLQHILARRELLKRPSMADVYAPELDTADPLEAMQQERDELTRRLNTLQREADHLELRWSHIQRQRAGLVGGASLDALHEELKRLESVIHQSLQAPTKTRYAPPLASDLLAELSDGQLVQICFEMRRHFLTVVDRQGNALSIDALTAEQRDQLYLALTLTLVRSYAHNGVKRPLILDEPFRHQDARSAARMARVLEQFAQAGHQVLVFAEDRTAWRCFSPSTAVFELEELRAPANPQSITPSIETTTHSRVSRKVTGSQTLLYGSQQSKAIATQTTFFTSRKRR